MTASRRDIRLDFFRGMALIMICIHHVYDNRLGGYTLRGFGISDTGEVLFFLSGFVSAIAYSRILERRGMLGCVHAAGARALSIWIAHCAAVAGVLALALIWVGVPEISRVLYSLGVQWVLGDPIPRAFFAFTGLYQPYLFGILPLFIVLSLVTPPLLYLLHRSPLLLLALSAALWAFVQGNPWLTFPMYPVGGSWSFNPFAYQFIFVLGMFLAHVMGNGSLRLPRHWGLFALAVAALAATFLLHKAFPFLLKYGFADLPFMASWPGFPYTSKHNLEALRIVHFLILAYATWWVLGWEKLQSPAIVDAATRFAAPVARCGRHGLWVFSVGMIASYAGSFILAVLGKGYTVWVPLNVALISLMLFVGWAVEARPRSLVRTA